MPVGRKDYTGDQATKEPRDQATKEPRDQATKEPRDQADRRVAVLEDSHGPLVPWSRGSAARVVFRLAWSLGRLVPWSLSVGAWRSGSRRASGPQAPPLRQGPQRRR